MYLYYYLPQLYLWNKIFKDKVWHLCIVDATICGAKTTGVEEYYSKIKNPDYYGRPCGVCGWDVPYHISGASIAIVVQN
jgi:hypothetical protein